MTESTGTYYSTLPDGRVLLACTLPEQADGTEARVLWPDRDEITPVQRKKIFAIVRDIADSQLEDREWTRKTLTADFLRKNIDQLQLSALSLAITGNCDKGTASLFIDFLISTCMEFNVQTKEPLQAYADDLERYTYTALLHKRCLICGRKADLHHVDQVGMGYNRETKPQLGALVMPLCRVHHTEYHTIGGTEFGEKYHVSPVPMDKKIAARYHITGKAAS
jgi:hypothetical protein